MRLVIASDGLSYPEEAMKARLDRIARLEMSKVEGGHHLHMDAPERVARELGFSG